MLSKNKRTELRVRGWALSLLSNLGNRPGMPPDLGVLSPHGSRFFDGHDLAHRIADDPWTEPGRHQFAVPFPTLNSRDGHFPTSRELFAIEEGRGGEVSGGFQVGHRLGGRRAAPTEKSKTKSNKLTKFMKRILNWCSMDFDEPI